ncbi:hypothetical protein QMZ92_16320 [Streptomyces sp. HNM0645]|uniref:hypothetical protein n=1 Tax=Streptomyces sp. HNM0645 TaxID=2782343 RepID=UPI0024B7CAD0|nr:hypothetical protein [Streptomyces sp. HNM0645]MDI9885900.1 hypothetical protein [Streptomyces sp. HNM0645]
MFIVYDPKDGETEHFDARTLRVSETSIAQRTIDRKWAEIEQGIRDEDLECLRVVAWVIKKRGVPTLRFGDFDPLIGDLYMRLDKDEVVHWIEGAMAIAAASSDDTVDDIRAALSGLPNAAFDREHAERMIEEMLANPKGERDSQSNGENGDETQTSTSSEPNTSSSSAASSATEQPMSTS